MEFERMGDNTIRVVVDHDDLEDRGISISELLESRERIERFFYAVLEEIDVEADFFEGQHMSFQVLPSKRGLELFISKISNDMNAEELLKILTGSSKVIKYENSNKIPATVKRALGENTTKKMKVVKKEVPVPTNIVMRFSTIDGILTMSKLINNDLKCDIYFYRNGYYGHFTLPSTYTNDQRRDVIANLLEFGNLSALSGPMIRECAQLIAEDYSFKN